LFNGRGFVSTPASCRVFALLCAASVLIWRNPLLATLTLALRDDAYTHILLVIPVSAMLMVMAWHKGAWKPKPSMHIGTALLCAAAVVGLCGLRWGKVDLLTGDVRLAIEMLAVVVWLIGSVVFSFGVHIFRRGLFPLLFLLWLVPMPQFMLNRVVEILQQGTTSAARLLFTITGIPVTQDGKTLTIPRLTVEVAEECSSIRSSMMLVVTSTVMSYLLLRSLWGRTLVMLAAIPLSIAKNGLRVFTLAVLGSYVDPEILNSPLHRQGGIVFFAIALAGMFGMIWLAARLERTPDKPSTTAQLPSLSTSAIK
jgi:exosortase